MSSKQAFSASECAFGSDQKGQPICSRPAVIDALKSWGKLNPHASASETVERAKKLANCKSESCLYKNKSISQWLRKCISAEAKDMLEEDFKPAGPYKAIEPL